MASKNTRKGEKPSDSKTGKTETTQKKKQAKTNAKINKKQREKPISKKKTLKVKSKTLNYSLCIPNNIIDQCTNLEQITHIMYQIAKSATMFNVGEIVILETSSKTDNNKSKKKDGKLSNSMLMASLLQYFVTPPYLLKSVFKKEYWKYFTVASKLPRLSVLPFMRYLKEDEGRYREGLAIRMEKPNAKSNKEFKQTKYINIGKSDALELKSQLVPINVRVTVDTVERKVVSPDEAYGDFVGAKASYGYHVRVAKQFADVFTECAFPGGYSQAVWVNSGDYYYDGSLKKYLKTETQVPYLEGILSGSTSSESETQDDIAALLLVLGKWDTLKASFNASRDQFEGCSGVHEFFDGQLELPGSVPQGQVPVHDGCMMALTLVGTLRR
ncbi:hypothetical protein TBLA_0C07130 [Henningerozyma blattae CBS 6284]|uniref:Methyltransferase n=1 Tax=Henningerozyma blattae (strain ATCC 34711 / CBS 6284 / DSM 70876 / NBRC 10599 / NRRL Y-10934 / UCD 77-7) TaxID=1071380 RepID=I2H2A2_HENB6|nr:hypothetical protein TBLA_0C07130 [Tetrapisispora blattae CBS 6284]CCH60504.1 hypothetical protein TBLA_0C07130 [Tetrapisispora blattae CBS 6284]